jgi:hypothetical protein
MVLDVAFLVWIHSQIDVHMQWRLLRLRPPRRCRPYRPRRSTLASSTSSSRGRKWRRWGEGEVDGDGDASRKTVEDQGRAMARSASTRWRRIGRWERALTRKPHRAGSGLAPGERPTRPFDPGQAPGLWPALVSQAPSPIQATKHLKTG